MRDKQDACPHALYGEAGLPPEASCLSGLEGQLVCEGGSAAAAGWANF
jgi:hypothetical protein